MSSENEKTEGTVESTINAYYDEILQGGDDKRAINEYQQNLDRIRLEFIEKTRIQGIDVPFLFFAVMLQCSRIYVIDRLTEIETANTKGGREDKLHEFQDRIFERFNPGHTAAIGSLYTPFEAIVSLRGVPYDATGYLSDDIKRLKLFKGANHRFATLGHDPVLGLIFGTANILTSTITFTRKNAFLPTISTYHVQYDQLNKNPKIGMPVSTVKMLSKARDRFDNDKKSVAAAVIKQLIHIATDLYTPCGIQLPGANLVLTNTSTERLTSYINSGDVIKAGASASMAMMINYIVSAVHGCKLLFENNEDPMNDDLYQARTRKIIMYSNLIASSSNVISTSLSKDIKKLDVGGLLVTIYRLFNDSAFIARLEEEFINSEASKIYEERIQKELVYL